MQIVINKPLMLSAMNKPPMVNAINKPLMPSVGMLNVVMLSVVAPF